MLVAKQLDEKKTFSTAKIRQIIIKFSFNFLEKNTDFIVHFKFRCIKCFENTMPTSHISIYINSCCQTSLTFFLLLIYKILYIVVAYVKSIFDEDFVHRRLIWLSL